MGKSPCVCMKYYIVEMSILGFPGSLNPRAKFAMAFQINLVELESITIY